MCEPRENRGRKEEIKPRALDFLDRPSPLHYKPRYVRV